jgi:hypothetical protein
LQHIDSIKSRCKVIIRLVTSLLKRYERLCDRYQVRLDREGKEVRKGTGRTKTPELLAHFPHVAMDVGPSNLRTQRSGLGRNQLLDPLCCEKMKQGVVGGRYGSPQTCLSRLLRLSRSKMLSLIEQIIIERHSLLDSFFYQSSRIRPIVNVLIKNFIDDNLDKIVQFFNFFFSRLHIFADEQLKVQRGIARLILPEVERDPTNATWTLELGIVSVYDFLDTLIFRLRRPTCRGLSHHYSLQPGSHRLSRLFGAAKWCSWATFTTDRRILSLNSPSQQGFAVVLARRA